MLIILEGTSGQESAVDVFDVARIFPAAQKGEGPHAIPVLGVSMLITKDGQQTVVKEGVRSLTERVNAARKETALLAAGKEPTLPLTGDSILPGRRLL